MGRKNGHGGTVQEFSKEDVERAGRHLAGGISFLPPLCLGVCIVIMGAVLAGRVADSVWSRPTVGIVLLGTAGLYLNLGAVIEVLRLQAGTAKMSRWVFKYCQWLPHGATLLICGEIILGKRAAAIPNTALVLVAIASIILMWEVCARIQYRCARRYLQAGGTINDA